MTKLSTPLFGMDSTSEVSPSAHHAVGSTIAIRYISRYTPKMVTKREFEDYKQHGIHLVGVFEDGADNAFAGYEQGKADGEYALRACQAIGMPHGTPLPFACDRDPSGREHQTDAYYDGVAAVWSHALCGPYGGYPLVAHTFARGFGYAYSTYAWSGGLVHPEAQVHQYSNDHVVGGVGVDYDHALRANYGQWDYAPARPFPAKQDGLHHDLFEDRSFLIDGRQIPERGTVVKYDHIRLHAKLHRHEIAIIERDLNLLAWRVFREATTKPDGSRRKIGEWRYKERGRRFQELWHRSKGIQYPYHKPGHYSPAWG